VHSYGDALKITTSAHKVESMFKTKLYQHEHIYHSGLRVLRQRDGITIPEDIKDKVYMVTGLTAFPFVKKHSKSLFGSTGVPDFSAYETYVLIYPY
jgi:hypothetical protein